MSIYSRAAGTVVLMAALYPIPGLAQSSDTQQILQLLQGMNKRLDTIEHRLDKVENQPAGPVSAAQGAAVATTPAKAEKPANAVPGWRISILPFATNDSLADTPLARVRAPIGPTKFNLHYGNGRVTNQVDYRGTAFFWAKAPGKYTFSIGVDQSQAGRYNCQTGLKVEDKELIAMGRRGNEHPFTSSGGIELQEGKYQISYDVACWNAFGMPVQPLRSDNDIEDYKRISYDVTVLGPDDDQLRDFAPDELFILKK